MKFINSYIIKLSLNLLNSFCYQRNSLTRICLKAECHGDTWPHRQAASAAPADSHVPLPKGSLVRSLGTLVNSRFLKKCGHVTTWLKVK